MSSVSSSKPPESSAGTRKPTGLFSAHARWLVPTLVYVFGLGIFGVTSKLALEHLNWQHLIFWSGVGYLIVLSIMFVRGDVKLVFAKGTWWAIWAAVAAIGGLVALYIALGHGPANEIVPISAVYPAVTLIFSAISLRERISPAKIIGVILVIGGVVMITAS